MQQVDGWFQCLACIKHGGRAGGEEGVQGSWIGSCGSFWIGRLAGRVNQTDTVLHACSDGKNTCVRQQARSPAFTFQTLHSTPNQATDNLLRYSNSNALQHTKHGISEKSSADFECHAAAHRRIA